MSMVNVVLLEDILKEVTSLVEETQTNNGLGNTDTLTSEDTSKTELRRILNHFSDGLDDGDALAGNLGSLHDNLQSRQGVGDDDVDRTDDRRGNQTSARSSHASVISEFCLNVLLQTGLSDESQSGRCQGVTHEWHSSSEERSKALGGRLSENFHNGLGGSSLLEESSLLLFDHSNGVDERSTQDAGASGRQESRRFSLVHEKGNAKQNSKLGNALEADADESRCDSRQRGRDRVSSKDGLCLGTGNLRIDRLSVESLGILLDQLTIGSHRIVHDSLKGRTSQVGTHGLELRESGLLHNKVIIGDQRHGGGLCRHVNVIANKSQVTQVQRPDCRTQMRL